MRRVFAIGFLLAVAGAAVFGVSAAAAGCHAMGGLHALIGMEGFPCALAGFTHHLGAVVVAFSAVAVSAAIFFPRFVSAFLNSENSTVSMRFFFQHRAAGGIPPFDIPLSLTQTLFRKGILQRREAPGLSH